MHSAHSLLRKSGFTLNELTLSAALLSGVLLATFATMHAGQNTIARGETVASAQTSALDCLRRVLEPMPAAKITALATAGDTVTFMLPYNQDDGIGDFDPATDISWGSESDEFGGTVTYRFVTSRTLAESTEGLDYNRDGDTGDSFDLGHILRIDDVTGMRAPVSSDFFVTVTGNHGGDIDSDGQADPIFRVVTASTGDQLIANLWCLRIDKEKRPYLLNLKSRVSLRNEQ